MRVTPANAPLGAIIEDLDLSAPLAAEDFSAIRDALHRHSVVAFRDQRLTPQQQVDFCGRFGTLSSGWASGNTRPRTA